MQKYKTYKMIFFLLYNHLFKNNVEKNYVFVPRWYINP
jgi:hypothetical protein